MHRTIRVHNIRLWVSIRKVEDMRGMCSNLKDGRHILMWDFDNKPLSDVLSVLRAAQKKWQLPKVYVLETKPKENYIAYCFEALKWEGALALVLETPGVCWNFFRLSVIRGYFTLRYSAKAGRTPRLVFTLPGLTHEAVGVKDLVHAIRYETTKKR